MQIADCRLRIDDYGCGAMALWAMRRSRLLVPVLLVAGCLVTLGAAGRPAGAPTDAISVGGLERRLRFIASDALEGRESLSPGFRAAAEYLVSELTGLGLTPRGDDWLVPAARDDAAHVGRPGEDDRRSGRTDLHVRRRPVGQRRRFGDRPRRVCRPRLPDSVEENRPVRGRRGEGRAAARAVWHAARRDLRANCRPSRRAPTGGDPKTTPARWVRAA